MRRETIRRVCLAFAGAAAILAPAAHANTVGIGSSLTASGFSAVPFGPPATVTNYVLPAPATAASPVDGTVISWRFIGSGGPLTPRVLRSVSGTTMTGAGTGTPQNATAPGAISGPFPLSLSIKKGEFFGVDGAGDGTPTTLYVAATPNATNLYFQPALANGGPGQSPTGTNPGEDAIGATVRFCLVPKLKGKSAKRARQALRAADCTIGTATKAKKRRKKKVVLSQSVKAGTSISDTQPVNFKLSRRNRS